MKRPVIKDVAQLAGVSTATVSHVLNKTRFVEEGTTKRVLDAIEQLHYVSNNWAKSLKSGKSNIISIMAANLHNQYEVDIQSAALFALHAHGYQLNIVPIFTQCEESIESSFQTLRSNNSAGLLFMPFYTMDLHPYVQSLNIPTVCVEVMSDTFDTVSTNHMEATRDAVLLMAQKHTRIGFISGDSSYPTSAQRLNGYYQALHIAGLAQDPAYVACGHSSVSGGYRAALELFKTDISALFVANNSMFQGTLQAIRETDNSIFDKIALAAFDDQEWYSLYRPSITAIRQPLTAMTNAAVELLIARIEEPSRPLEHVIIPSELVRRETF